MSKHKEHTYYFQRRLDDQGIKQDFNNGTKFIDLTNKKSKYDTQQQVIDLALKCADISSSAHKDFVISHYWTYRHYEEFFDQGDRERELALRETKLFDRSQINVSRS